MSLVLVSVRLVSSAQAASHRLVARVLEFWASILHTCTVADTLYPRRPVNFLNAVRKPARICMRLGAFYGSRIG